MMQESDTIEDLKQKLFIAIKAGDIESVMKLVKQRAELVAAKNGYGTPLHEAVYQGKIETVDFLLANGADINARNSYGKTPLHIVAEKNAWQAIIYLITHGANIEAQDNYGKTPLCLAVQSNAFETITCLLLYEAHLEAQGNKHKTPLHLAYREKSNSAIKLLEEKGADIQAQDKDENTFKEVGYKYSVLKKPIKIQELLQQQKYSITQSIKPYFLNIEFYELEYAKEFVAQLLKIGLGNRNMPDQPKKIEPILANPISNNNAQDRYVIELTEDEWNALKLSEQSTEHDQNYRNNKSQSENNQIQSKIAEEDNTIEAVDSKLFDAIKAGNIKDIEGLLGQSAIIEARNEYGTPLHEAVYQGKIEIVNLLLDNGADINAKEKEKKTPILLAAIKKDHAMVKFLLEKGANYNVQDDYGKIPLHIAAETNTWQAIIYLLNHGADIEARDKFERTPIHLAAANDAVKAIKYLWIWGAQLEAQDNKGRTPLHLAHRNNKKEAIKCLEGKGANREVKDKKGDTPKEVGFKHKAHNYRLKKQAEDQKNKKPSIIEEDDNKQTSLKEKQKQVVTDPEIQTSLIKKARLVNSLGVNRYKQGIYQEALQLFLRAFHAAKLAASDPKKDTDLASVYYNLASAFKKTEQLNLAKNYFFKAYKIKKNVHGEEHQSTLKTDERFKECLKLLASASKDIKKDNTTAQSVFSNKNKQNVSSNFDISKNKESVQRTEPDMTRLQQLLQNSSIEPLSNQGKRIIFQDTNLAKSFVEEIFNIGFENRGMQNARRKIQVLENDMEHSQERYAIDLTADEWDALNYFDPQQQQPMTQLNKHSRNKRPTI